jgi:hypothetical protein
VGLRRISTSTAVGVGEFPHVIPITINNPSGVILANFPSETEPAHLPSKGDELCYVDASGNAKQGKVERRIFYFATPVSTYQVIFVVSLTG